MTKMTPIESEFATTDQAEAHEAWVRAKVETALASQEPAVPHDQVINYRDTCNYPSIRP